METICKNWFGFNKCVQQKSIYFYIWLIDVYKPIKTAGARQRALDRADVPPELRGHVSAARWKQELRAFHEEQVRLAAAQRRVAGEAAPDAAAARRKKARERATEHARREVR